MSVLDTIREMSDNIAHNPPVWAIYAHHSVPWGERFTQYDTNGRKIVWINRGELAELPTMAVRWVGDGALTGVLGIPVFNL